MPTRFAPARVLACLWLLAGTPIALRAELSAGEADAVGAALLAEETPRLPRTARSRSGRFRLFGDDPRELMDLSGWAEGIAEALARQSGWPLDFGDDVRIEIQCLPAAPGRGVEVSSRLLDAARAVLVLTLHGYSEVEPRDVRFALVELLTVAGLHADALARARAGGDAVLTGAAAERQAALAAGTPPRVVEWVLDGMAGALSVRERAWAVDAACDLWREGRLAPPSRFLASRHTTVEGAGAAPVPEALPAVALTRAEYALALVGFLDARTDRLQTWRGVFERMADGQSVDLAWMLKTLALPDVPALDAAWDDWILRQTRVVRAPGQDSVRSLRALRSALLLYPGASGIPLVEGDPFRPLPMGEIVRRRRAAWIPGWAVRKTTELRTLAAGRSDGYRAVIETVCTFLGGLSGDSSDAALYRLLRDAEAGLVRLEEGLDEERGKGTEESEP